MRWKNWKMIPTCLPRQRASAFSPRTASEFPPTTISPVVGWSMPVIKLSRVDLPLPDGPLIANMLNRGMLKLTSSIMRCPVVADPIKRVRCLATTRLPRG